MSGTTSWFIIWKWTQNLREYTFEELEDWYSRKAGVLTPVWRKMVDKEYAKRMKTRKEKVLFT